MFFEKIEEILEPEFFSSKINRLFLNQLENFVVNDQIANINTIKVQLDGNEEFIRNGGVSYLLKLCENTISIINSKQYDELIQDLFMRRKLIDLGTDLINDSTTENDYIQVYLIEKTEQSLFNLTNKNDVSTGPRDFEDIMHKTLDIA